MRARRIFADSGSDSGSNEDGGSGDGEGRMHTVVPAEASGAKKKKQEEQRQRSKGGRPAIYESERTTRRTCEKRSEGGNGTHCLATTSSGEEGELGRGQAPWRGWEAGMGYVGPLGRPLQCAALSTDTCPTAYSTRYGL